jgi:hypothetical protein
MVIDLNNESTYLNWRQWILSVFGWSVGEGKSLDQKLPQSLGNTGLLTLLGSFGLFESPAACSALLRWAGLQDVQAVDYHALRERDIERLADLVEKHLDTGLLRQLCGF